MATGVIYPNEGGAQSVFSITNNRLKRFNENPVLVGGGIFAPINPDLDYTKIVFNPDLSGEVAILVDDNVRNDMGFLMYEDWDGNDGSVPRPPVNGGYPTPQGDDLRSRFQAGTLYEDITSWFES